MAMMCTGPSLSRRAVLGSAGALFAWAYMPKIARAAGNRDFRFVCIVLRGGMDGLGVVGPVGDPDYGSLRSDLALRLDGPTPALPLDGFFALNPAMPETARLYRAGQVAIIHASATNYRNRSHFDAQDVLESGQPHPGVTQSGWLNRAIGGLAAGDRVNPAGSLLGVGTVPPLIARGATPMLGWAPSRLGAPDADLIARLETLYGKTDPRLLEALQEGVRLERIATAAGAPSKVANQTPEAEMAAGVGRLLVSDNGPRIAALAIEGWDTHTDEAGALRRRLAALDSAFAALESSLGPKWQDTVVLVVTEFGRTARINGTNGTDHGNGTVAFLVGGAVRGGRVIADWPGLSDAALYENRDLRPTTDIRAVAKGVMADLFGLSAAQLASTVFPDSAAVAPMQGLVV